MIEIIDELKDSLSISRFSKANLKSISRDVTTSLTKTLNTRAGKDIQFAKLKLPTINSDSISIDKLFNDIIESVLKCEPFCIKLQSRLILDK